mgnify:CR=1 FL=1|jgi:hypothetical protein
MWAIFIGNSNKPVEMASKQKKNALGRAVAYENEIDVRHYGDICLI